MKCKKCNTELEWNYPSYRYEDCSNCGSSFYEKCDICGEILVTCYEEYSYKDCPKCRLHKDKPMLSKQEALDYAKNTMLCKTCKCNIHYQMSLEDSVTYYSKTLTMYSWCNSFEELQGCTHWEPQDE